MALVSLASSTDPNAVKPNRKLSTESMASVRNDVIQTPPPRMDTLSSTMITPSSTAATLNALNRSHRAVISSSSSISDESNPRSDQSEPSISSHPNSHFEKSIIDRNYQGQSMPPKLPFSHTENLRPSVQDNQPPFPFNPRHSIPVPRLDIDHPNSAPGYTLTMKKDYRSRTEQDDVYVSRHPQYLTSDESSIHERRGRPTRFYSAPVEYGRRGSCDYDQGTETPPMMHLHEGRNRQLLHRAHSDYLRQQSLESRRSFEDERRTSFVNDNIVRHHVRRNRAVSGEDCDDRNQQYRSSRHHQPEDAYYSPSNHYLPLNQMQNHRQQYSHSSQPIPTRSVSLQHQPPAHHAYPQEVRVQFECPDRPGLKKGAHVPLYGDFTSSPYPLVNNYHGMKQNEGHRQIHRGTRRTILRRKCAWKNYPELEKFLIDNREEYLLHSAKNYTIEQKQYNNRLTERLLEVAAKHNYVFDPNDFNFVAVRDRIRCYYKSYVQSNKKRGVIVGYDAMGSKKKCKIEDKSGQKIEHEEKPVDEVEISEKNKGDVGENNTVN